MSELNKTFTIQALEDGISEEIESEGSAYVDNEELDLAMEGYDVGVNTREGVIERLCGEHGWTYKETEDGFAVSDARWKLNNV